MTLAVAACYPWQELLDALPKNVQRALDVIPDIQLESAILLAADSRWSYTIGTDFDDGGVKLAAIDSHAAGVYAGNTAAGEKAFARLGAEFSRVRNAGCNSGLNPQQILQAVWREHKHQGGGLHLCIGLIDYAGQPVLFRFDDDDDFRPRRLNGVETLGWPTACSYFSKRLQEEILRETSTPLIEKAFALSAEHWGGVIAHLVYETSEKKIDSTVGGPILYAIITPKGAEGRSLWLVDPGPDQPKVERLSLTPQQVEDFYRRQRERSEPWSEASGIRKYD